MHQTLFFDSTAFWVACARRRIRTLTKFARETNTSEAYMRQLAHGRIPSLATRIRLAAFLEVAPESIWPPVPTCAQATATGRR